MRKVIGRWLTEAGLSWRRPKTRRPPGRTCNSTTSKWLRSMSRCPVAPAPSCCPEIKQHSPDTQVIMLTAHDEAALAIRMLTQGAFGFLVKPVSWERPGSASEEGDGAPAVGDPAATTRAGAGRESARTDGFPTGCKTTNVAFRSAKVALLSRGERRLCRHLIPFQ